MKKNGRMGALVKQTGRMTKSAADKLPVQIQYSPDEHGVYYDIVSCDDRFMRISFDGGKTWSAGYRFTAATPTKYYATFGTQQSRSSTRQKAAISTIAGGF